jgi:polysaccharide deacetylase family protein (PEP-CTERM system associated)
MITRQTRQEFSADVRRAKGILEDLGGREVVGYRAPTFSITKGTEWALEVLFENDLLYDASVYPIRHDRYGIPAAPRFPYAAIERGGRRLWEFPGPTLRLAGITLPAAGGGYLRLFPYRWARAAIRATNRTGRTMTVFAHPWEFDAGLPDVKLPWVAHVRHYGGIRGNGKKLRRLLSEFRFAPLIDVLRRLERKSRAGEGG